MKTTDNIIKIEEQLSTAQLSELEQIVIKEPELLYITFSKQQPSDVWKAINRIIVAGNPFLQLDFSNDKGWGEWADLSFLEHLPDLQRLIINEWHLQDLSPIANLTKLKKVLFQGEFKSAKASLKPLAGLRNIEDFSSNHIKDIETISNFTKIKKLSIEKIKTSNLDFVQTLNDLESFYCKGSDKITDFSGLYHLPKLAFATFIKNYKAENIEFITHLKNVKRLSIMDFNLVEVIPSLKNLTNLEYFKVNTLKNLNDIRGIADAKNLTELSVYAGSKTLKPENFNVLKGHLNLKTIRAGFGNEKENIEFETVKSEILGHLSK